ncbi:MAG: DUF4418 family protein [Treponema sp.]|nr:DUF4418 family protein [Treponema sp.]
MKKISPADIFLFILSLILFLGSHFLFHACPAKTDGSWMVCHWAERVITASGLLFTLLSLCCFFLPDAKIKAGISLTFIPLSIVTMLVPGVIVNLCMMKDMRCHTVMRPAVSVLCILIACLSLIDFILAIKKSSGEAK